jgi:putative intracellular protease/amidase
VLTLSTVPSLGAQMSKGKVLVLVSAAADVPLREGGSHRTGVFLGELVEPAIAMVDAGYELEFASPGGRKPTIDPDSHRLMYWHGSKAKLARAKAKLARLVALGLNSPSKIEDLAADGSSLENYVGVFAPGGHGPITDLFYVNGTREPNLDVAKILGFFHTTGRPTGLICHASVLAANVTNGDGTWAYAGYKMTVITRLTEWMNEDFPPTKVMRGHLVEYPVDVLKEKGAKLSLQMIPMVPHVVEDRELMTGQDPFSAARMGKLFVRKLDASL